MYVLASATAAALIGLMLGWLGDLTPLQPRIAVATLLAVAATVMGAVELSGRRVRPLQCDRETPQSWVHLGPIRWAAINGATLGIGASSRLGFWLWYVVPIGAFLIGDPAAGALTYGLYGFLRSAGAGALFIAWNITDDPDRCADWLFARAPLARRLAAAQLLAVGIIACVAVGG